MQIIQSTNHRSDIIICLTAALLWATAFIGPSAVQPAGELLLVTGRYILFGLCGLYVVFKNWPEVRKLSPWLICFGLHLGVVGYLIFYIAVSFAVVIGGGFITAIIVGSSPIGIAVVGNFVEKRTKWIALIPAVLLIFSGVVCISTSQLLSQAGSPKLVSPVLGVALSLLASSVWTYFVVVNSYVQRKWKSIPSNNIWAAFVAMGAGAGSLLLLPTALHDTPSETFSFFVLGNLCIWIIWLGYFSSWLGTLIWVRAATRIPASLSGPLLATEPIFGALLSLGWERRVPTVSETIGSSLIFTGVASILIMNFGRSKNQIAGQPP